MKTIKKTNTKPIFLILKNKKWNIKKEELKQVKKDKNGKIIETKTIITTKMIDVIQVEKTAYNIRNAKANQSNANYKIYRLGYINPNELQALITLLKPYAEFLNELIPKAKFESNADFKKTKLPYVDDSLNKQEYRFKLENIYIIDKTNCNEVLRAIKNYTNTNTNTNANTIKNQH